jgi:hypothetical protein
MKKSLLFAFIAIALTSCWENADPGPLQAGEKSYAFVDFDRLEMGNALNVTVEQGSTYSINVTGDRRDIEDLVVDNINGKLRMTFKTPGHGYNRQYTTYVKIRMPLLTGVSFSGAVTSNITGFTTAGDLNVDLSGASKLNVSGSTTNLQAVVSGASDLDAFNLETSTATVDASGASKIKVLVTQQLKANASGASDIRYRGTPTVTISVSGASAIGAD